MRPPTIESLQADLSAIEAAVDDGSYEKGPWARFLRESSLIEPEHRGPLVEHVSRISDKLHAFNRPDVRRFSLERGLALEWLVLFAGVAGVVLFAGLGWAVAIWLAAYAVCTAAQPLFKMLVGRLLGVRYSHFWIWNRIEPRVKMQYGTYWALPTNSRIALHLSGTVGSAAAFLIIGYTIVPWQPTAAVACQITGWFFVALNAALFFLGYFRVGSIRRTFSGGAAADEILRRRKVEAMRRQLKAQAAS